MILAALDLNHSQTLIKYINHILMLLRDLNASYLAEPALILINANHATHIYILKKIFIWTMLNVLKSVHWGNIQIKIEFVNHV